MKRFFLRFLGVGGTATAIQYLLLVVLVNLADLDPVVASASGFVVSSLFNYFANYVFTFSSSQSHRIAMPRFYVMVAGGLLINSAVMALLVHGLSLNYIVAQLLATSVLIIYNFFVSWLWVYKG